MLLGLLFAIGACCVWGLIFVIPDYLSDYSAMEIVLGRYFTYGILSALLFFRSGFAQIQRYPLKAWMNAFTFAFLSNLIYYMGLVAGLRFASPTLAVLIVGLAPIVISFYGNLQAREVAFRDLAIPSIWTGFGLVLVNATEVDWSFEAKSFGEYLFGIIGVFIALLAWSWYAVQNAQFLKKNPQIPASQWSTIMGVATLFWVILIGGVFACVAQQEVNLTKFLTLSPDTYRFFLGAAILGLACSWLGCFLWSQASIYLPISLMGPLLIFETLFGLLFVFLCKKQLPSWIELIGVCSMVAGILGSIKVFKKRKIIG